MAPTPSNNPPTKPQADSLMRNLGSFFGHIWAGVKATPDAPAPPLRQTVAHSVEEQHQPAPDGQSHLTLRRTTIDEIIVRPTPPAPPTQANP